MPLCGLERAQKLVELTSGRMNAGSPDLPRESETIEGWQIVGDVCERQPQSSAAPQLPPTVSSTAFPKATHRRVSKVRRLSRMHVSHVTAHMAALYAA